MDYEYEQEKARTQQDGRNNTEAQYLITNFDTWVSNPFWDGVKVMDFSEPEPERAICDCEGPHFIGAQISCRGLDGIGATGIFAK